MKPPLSAKKKLAASPAAGAAGGPAKVAAARAAEAAEAREADVPESAPAVPPVPLDTKQIAKAAAALQKHLAAARAGAPKAALFEDDAADEFLYLVVALKRMPGEKSVKPHRIAVPHPLYTAASCEACLIVKDHDGEGHKEAKKKMAAAERCGVTKVLGVSKLRADYSGVEARRQLCASYDLFLADSRVLRMLPRLLGKTFFKKKKQPIPVNLTKQDWAAQVKKALGGTYLYLSGGTCLVLRVARAAMTGSAIVQNVVAAAQGVAGAVPRKWSNVQALYLKTTESVSLPIYTALPELPAPEA